MRPLNRAKYERIEKRKRVLEYQEACVKMLKEINNNGKIDLGTHALTSAKMLEFLFLTVIPDQVERRSKLRQIFRGKLWKGDDLYLRIAYDYVKNAEQISRKLTAKYRKEIEQFNNQKNRIV